MKFKVTTSGSGACYVRWVYTSPNNEPSDNGEVNIKPDSGGVMDKIFTNTGTYVVKAMGSPSASPKCNGEATMTLVVARKKLSFQLPTSCPPPYKIAYGKGTGSSPTDFEKGAATCTKSAPECPAGFSTIFNAANGHLQCTPIITATCPLGWTGVVTDKNKLFCTSIPQPLVSCPTTDMWEWGNSYFTESWNLMGCFSNNKPAY